VRGSGAFRSALRTRRRAQPRREPEHDLQVLVAGFLDVALAGVCLWSSIDHGAGEMSGRAAGRRKARGVKPGWPDIQVIWGAPGAVRVLLGIELKAGKGRQDAEQMALEAAWVAQGGLYRVCRSLAEVDAALVGVGIPLRYRVAPCGTRWVFAGWEGAPA
jgi:hypothetical protein